MPSNAIRITPASMQQRAERKQCARRAQRAGSTRARQHISSAQRARMRGEMRVNAGSSASMRRQRASECEVAAARARAAEATLEGEKLGSQREKFAEGKEAEGKQQQPRKSCAIRL